jgi:hypothetical protein
MPDKGKRKPARKPKQTTEKQQPASATQEKPRKGKPRHKK